MTMDPRRDFTKPLPRKLEAVKGPGKRDLADALRVLSLLLGPHFTGIIELHFNDGEFRQMVLPPQKKTRRDLGL
jgi:hypothetical protein